MTAYDAEIRHWSPVSRRFPAAITEIAAASADKLRQAGVTSRRTVNFLIHFVHKLELFPNAPGALLEFVHFLAYPQAFSNQFDCGIKDAFQQSRIK